MRAGLEKLQAEKAKEIEDRGATLRERQQAFERNASILTETAREQRLRDLERFELDVKRFIEDAQAELMGARRQAEGAFLAKLGPVVEAVAKKRELHLVLNQDTGIVIWGVPEVDITSEVVAELGTR